MRLAGEPLVHGTATGPALVLAEPLSFWGGVDPETGEVIDRHHPQSGLFTTGRVVVMPHGRGSSSSSYVLADCIRAGTGPVAVILGEPDSIIALGAMVAAELYPDRRCPVVVAPECTRRIPEGAMVTVHSDGTIEIREPAAG